jgi:hypothetical protein
MGSNYANANPTSHSVVLDIPGKSAGRSCEGNDHERRARRGAGFSDALHGRAGAERGRSDQRHVETG